MNPIPVSYTRAPKATALFLDYVYHFNRVQRFYDAPPFEFASFREAARKVEGWRGDREALAEILTRQNQAFGCSEATLANIRRLREPGTLAVVTGQQVGLFSGPAFTLYKALTAVRLAQSLSRRGLVSVPIFWLATEDHDLDEVARTAVLDEAGGLVPVSDSGMSPAPRSSVGYVKLSSEVAGTLDHLQEVLPPGEPRQRLMRDLRECYISGATWGEAFGRLMARLFSRFGVVLIDPLNAEVHQVARACYEQALRDANPLRRLLQARSKELVDAGYHVQVHVGDDSTLLFAAPDGNRAAIRHRDGDFSIEGTNSPSGGVEGWIASRPLLFSPSALLRPVIQDTLLPTVAYVAGPAELAYFGQAQVIYRQFGRAMPVIFPRSGFTLADHRLGRLLEKYHLTLEDVWQGEEHLRRQIAAASLGENGGQGWGSRLAEDMNLGPNDSGDADPAITAGVAAMAMGALAGGETWVTRLREAEGNLKRLLEGLRQDVKPIDPTLLDAIRNGEEKILYQIDRLKGKISRAAVDRSDLLRRHQQDLVRFLMPAGNLQEREVSGIYFLARAGYELLDRLLAEIQTDGADHQLFVY